MKVYKIKAGAVIEYDNQFFTLDVDDWDTFLNRTNLHAALLNDLVGLAVVDDVVLNALEIPMGTQEIWASGVTYMRSKEARMEESKDSGGGTFYDRVYDADRPELFFKATSQRAVAHGGTVRIRKDSEWNVPEPELTLLISAEGTIEGYTIGNDMSSRDIEGENPLYLPQAKTYEGCAALGPCIFVSKDPINVDTKISLDILRDGKTVFSGQVSINTMKRKHQDLVDYLFRECNFPQGCFLMTGTGIIPPDEFTLQIGDETRISIEGIGTLMNVVG
ncbi:MAG: fumarylacetoacetate hydrolase family protein [Maribacter sp.]